MCGHIVCSKCSGGMYSVVIENQESIRKQRVCSSCFEVQITEKFTTPVLHDNWL
ncbi:hypothetical protein HMI56_003408, partial [Coelomomyces lativittatus]